MYCANIGFLSIQNNKLNNVQSFYLCIISTSPYNNKNNQYSVQQGQAFQTCTINIFVTAYLFNIIISEDEIVYFLFSCSLTWCSVKYHPSTYKEHIHNRTICVINPYQKCPLESLRIKYVMFICDYTRRNESKHPVECKLSSLRNDKLFLRLLF